MASQTQPCLDCKPYSYSMLLKSFSDQTNHSYHLQEFLSRLEQERVKIDAFKRELPLCMQLLTNAVEASRQQLEALRSNEARPVLEEFIPMKHSNSEDGCEKASKMISDKANWMTSAQLWSQTTESIITQPEETRDIGLSVSPTLGLNDKQRNGGAFLPFSKERNDVAMSCHVPPELALGSCEKETMKECEESFPKRENSCVDEGKTVELTSEAQAANTNTTHRKARRCWSPDLHRRFVNALQMLGGSQVATPKQIRELMKVDGLTNDEVKSHLQKYRLHTRRPSPSIQTETQGHAPQFVVLGGIWVPPEYATPATAVTHNGGHSIYSPQAISDAPPAHYFATAPQELYGVIPSQTLLPAPLHHHLRMYKTAPQTQSSPESNVRGGSDSIENGRSESSIRKEESGENVEKKGLAALRDQDGEESTESEITLKF